MMMKRFPFTKLNPWGLTPFQDDTLTLWLFLTAVTKISAKNAIIKCYLTEYRKKQLDRCWLSWWLWVGDCLVRLCLQPCALSVTVFSNFKKSLSLLVPMFHLNYRFLGARYNSLLKIFLFTGIKLNIEKVALGIN